MVLKKTSQNTIKKLYQLLFDVKRIFEAYRIKYWGIKGTVLGSVRHRGIIPWDDNINIGIMQIDLKHVYEIEKVFDNCGYKIVKTLFGCNIAYKTNFLKNQDLKISTFKLLNNKYVYSKKTHRDNRPNEWLYKYQVDTLVKTRFGDFNIMIPKESEKYIYRCYGRNWDKIGKSYNHGNIVETKLTQVDFKPAMPIKVVFRPCIKLCILKSPMQKSKATFMHKILKKCDPKKGIVCTKSFSQFNMGVYLINCDVHKERLLKFSSFAKKSGLHFCKEPCVKGFQFTPKILCEMRKQKLLSPKADMTPTEIAINFSHINTWSNVVNNCLDYGLVLEDDCEINIDFVKKVNNIMISLKNIDFDILYLWNGNWAKTRNRCKKVGSFLRETVQYNAGGVAYIISNKFCTFLINKIFPIKYPQDMFIGMNVKHGIHLSVNTKKKANCYYSDLIKVDCGGEGGTGNTTQTYDAIKADRLLCNNCL